MIVPLIQMYFLMVLDFHFWGSKHVGKFQINLYTIFFVLAEAEKQLCFEKEERKKLNNRLFSMQHLLNRSNENSTDGENHLLKKKMSFQQLMQRFTKKFSLSSLVTNLNR